MIAFVGIECRFESLRSKQDRQEPRALDLLNFHILDVGTSRGARGENGSLVVSSYEDELYRAKQQAEEAALANQRKSSEEAVLRNDFDQRYEHLLQGLYLVFQRVVKPTTLEFASYSTKSDRIEQCIAIVDSIAAKSNSSKGVFKLEQIALSGRAIASLTIAREQVAQSERWSCPRLQLIAFGSRKLELVDLRLCRQTNTAIALEVEEILKEAVISFIRLNPNRLKNQAGEELVSAKQEVPAETLVVPVISKSLIEELFPLVVTQRASGRSYTGQFATIGLLVGCIGGCVNCFHIVNTSPDPFLEPLVALALWMLIGSGLGAMIGAISSEKG